MYKSEDFIYSESDHSLYQSVIKHLLCVKATRYSQMLQLVISVFAYKLEVNMNKKLNNKSVSL